jgi:hypothetical protein
MIETLIGQGIEGILNKRKRSKILLDLPRICIDFLLKNRLITIDYIMVRPQLLPDSFTVWKPTMWQLGRTIKHGEEESYSYITSQS